MHVYMDFITWITVIVKTGERVSTMPFNDNMDRFVKQQLLLKWTKETAFILNIFTHYDDHILRHLCVRLYRKHLHVIIYSAWKYNTQCTKTTIFYMHLCYIFPHIYIPVKPGSSDHCDKRPTSLKRPHCYYTG